jgi:hypothetical protein
MIVFIHSIEGNISTKNLKGGMNAKKNKIIRVDKVIVALKPKRERDLEYLGSLNIKILKNVM